MLDYRNNPALREAYLKANNITHAFSWKEGERHYVLYFGSDDCTGWPEERFTSMRALKAKLSEYYPELAGAFYRGNH